MADYDNNTRKSIFEEYHYDNDTKSEPTYSPVALAIYAFLNSKTFFILISITWTLLVVLGVIGKHFFYQLCICKL